MFVPWLPSRGCTAAVRSYVSTGGREVEFDLGTDLARDAPIERSFGGKPYRVEIRGSALLAARGASQRSSIVSRDVVPPFTFTGEVLWDASLVRGSFSMDVNLSRKRWAVIAAADLWHLALIIAGKTTAPA